MPPFVSCLSSNCQVLSLRHKCRFLHTPCPFCVCASGCFLASDKVGPGSHTAYAFFRSFFVPPSLSSTPLCRCWFGKNLRSLKYLCKPPSWSCSTPGSSTSTILPTLPQARRNSVVNEEDSRSQPWAILDEAFIVTTFLNILSNNMAFPPPSSWFFFSCLARNDSIVLIFWTEYFS